MPNSWLLQPELSSWACLFPLPPCLSSAPSRACVGALACCPLLSCCRRLALTSHPSQESSSSHLQFCKLEEPLILEIFSPGPATCSSVRQKPPLCGAVPWPGRVLRWACRHQVSRLQGDQGGLCGVPVPLRCCLQAWQLQGAGTGGQAARGERTDPAVGAGLAADTRSVAGGRSQGPSRPEARSVSG